MMNPSIITNMPENSDISGSIKIYLEKIIYDDKKIWVNDLYTELQAKEIIPVSLRLEERKEYDQTVFDVSELVAKESKLIISGGSGCGKTITLKWLNVIYANRCRKDEESIIPVYIGLNQYNKGTFHDYARKNIRNNGLSESAFDSLLNDNKIIFLIDGLDLLSSHEKFNPYSEIWDFISDHNDCRYVVSSRPGFFGLFERFTISELEGLNPENIGLFIIKYAQDDKICEPLKNKILGDEKLKSLFSNPLMLYLAIKVASRQKKDEILPSKRSQMYMEFIDGMFEHDSSKMPEGYRLHSNKHQILETLTDLFFYMQCKNVVSMDYCDALEIASKHSEDKRYKPVDAESILEDIFTVGLIPKNNSVITYGIHQSFQEYFSALKLKEYFEKGFDLIEAFRHPKWEEVVLFTSEMFDCPDDFVRSLINADELVLASKCAQNASRQIKEYICFLLADIFDKTRYSIEKKTVLESIQRFGDIGIIAIIQALDDNDAEVRWNAAWRLVKINSEKSIDTLIQALNDNDPKVRWNAASALGKIKSEKSIDALSQVMYDNNPKVRRSAAWALREIKSEKIIDPFNQAFHDNDADVGWNVVLGPREIKSEKSIDALSQALHDNNADVRWNAARALREIKSEKSIEVLIQALNDNDARVRKTAVWGLREIKSEKIIDTLIQALNDDNADVRCNAASALGKIKSEKSIDVLSQALYDNDAKVRQTVVSALGKIKSEKSIDSLSQALNDNNAKVRRIAACMLREIKSEKSIDSLSQALHDKDAKVRQTAASVLREIKSEKSIDVLSQTLHDNDAKVRQTVAQALGKIKSEKNIDALGQALHDNDADVRWNAARALREIKSEKSIEVLIQALNDNDAKVRWTAAQTLGKIKSEKSINALSQVLHDNDAKVRSTAAQALGKIRREKSIDALIHVLNDNNADVRSTAASALREIISEKSMNPLIQTLNDNDAYVKWNANSALREIKSEKSIDALIQALNDNDAYVRLTAASALGKIKSEKSLDVLSQALHDNNTKVRSTAAWALGKIKSEKSIDALSQALHDNDAKVRWTVTEALSEICNVRHKELLKEISLDSENEDAANKAFEILKKIEINEKSRAELFQKKPARRTESPSPSISTAQQPETGAQDPYFHIAVYEINKIRKSTVIVDYGCGYGKLLTPMKNLGADVLDNIHYIGVDARTACLLKSCWTAEKYGLFKNEPGFMTPDVFFKKDITVDFALLMHILHEIRLVDLVDSIYYITAKLSVGGQIFILEPGSFIEERNYVLWKDTDFKMIFSNHGFDIMPYPITTGKGNKLNAVNILKIRNENFPKETVSEKCLLMFEAKKKELFRMLNNNPTGSEKDKEIDLLYSYVSRQIDEYKAI